MIDFDEAIGVAGANMNKFVKSAIKVELEGALISGDGKLYEITFSYDTENFPDADKVGSAKANNLQQLVSILGKRREFKTFLVDSQTGAFRGFKNYKES